MEAQNTVWHRWKSYLGLLTHGTKKNLLVNVQKGWSS